MRKQSDVPLVHPDGTRAVKGGRGAAASDGSGKPVPEAENFEEELAERAELSGFTSAICYLFLSTWRNLVL